MGDFLQLLVSGTATGAIYAPAALGFTLLWQASGTINFAQGEFVMVPALVMLFFMGTAGAPLWLAFLLTCLVIRERIDNQASTMSGGEQKQLAIGRALLLHPRVLLIDEPSIGLSPKLVQDVMTLLRALADTGTTVLMVEQNVRTALKYANRALVLEMGRLALDRPASELLHDPNLNRLFLGGHVAGAERLEVA
jgi:ABC-type phosphate/phosphonate transport system ATPase subunit